MLAVISAVVIAVIVVALFLIGVGLFAPKDIDIMK